MNANTNIEMDVRDLKRKVPLYSWVLQLDIKGLTLSEKLILNLIVDKILHSKDCIYTGMNVYIYEFTGFAESTVKQGLTSLCDKHHLLKREKVSMRGIGKRHVYSVGEVLRPYILPLIEEERRAFV
jgi:hypothetical protein